MRVCVYVCVCVCIDGTYYCSADVGGFSCRNRWPQHSTGGWHSDVEAPVESLLLVTNVYRELAISEMEFD